MQPAVLMPLKGKNNFRDLFSSGIKFHEGKIFAIIKFVNVNPALHNKTIEFAVSVSRKNNKKAVVRNRIKRILRVGIKQIYNKDSILFTGFEKLLVSYGKTVLKPSLIGLKDIMPDLEKLFKNINNYYTKNFEVNPLEESTDYNY